MGHYEYVVIMPLSTFQVAMYNMFYLRKFVVIFFDDILTYSKNMSEYIDHLATVLNTLRKHEIFAKWSKCVLAQNSIEFLGHIVSNDSVYVDLKKMQAIKDLGLEFKVYDWPKPSNLVA